MKTTLWMLAGAVLIIVFCDFFRYEEWFIQLGNFLAIAMAIPLTIIYLPVCIAMVVGTLLAPITLLWTLVMLLMVLWSGLVALFEDKPKG